MQTVSYVQFIQNNRRKKLWVTAIATHFCLKGHKIIFFLQVASFMFKSRMEANSDGKLMTA